MANSGKKGLHARICYFITLWVFAIIFPFVASAANSIISYRYADNKDQTRFVIETIAYPRYRIFKLTKPDRVVVDIEKTQAGKPSGEGRSDIIEHVAVGQNDTSTARIVVEVSRSMVNIQSQVLLPDKNGHYRLVLDMTPRELTIDDLIPPLPVARGGGVVSGVPVPVVRESRKPAYKPVIMIDAGHGGHDPGTIGSHGLQEKNITLSYARALYDALKATGKYHPILTRNSDTFVTLRGRVALARKYKADLFISIHVNSHRNPHVKGLSVYSLSDRASDKEAAALARKENKADIINGMDLREEDRDVATTLIAIAQRDTMNQSAKFAERVVHEMQREVTLLNKPHRFAGFRVLTAADIPSVLIELGYITNYREAKLLTTESHKKELVHVLIRAINEQFQK